MEYIEYFEKYASCAPSAPAIHIAGSKGKGTVALLLSMLLKEAGFKIGTFTSPSMGHPRESIQISGEFLSQELWEEGEKHFSDPNLSEFELLTLIAFRAFDLAACDKIVVECGWGGARDATNILKNKELCILTHVEMEHVGILGNTIEEIYEEKMGILKAGTPLIMSIPLPVQVEGKVASLGIELIPAQSVKIAHHHPESLGIVLRAAEFLGLTINEKLLNKIKVAQLPARMEKRKFGKHLLIMDGAHTFDSVTYTENEIRELAKSEGYDEVFWGIHFLSDKNPALPKLFPRHKSIWLNIEDPRKGTPPRDMRSQSIPEFLMNLRQDQNPKCVGIVGSFKLISALRGSLDI